MRIIKLALFLFYFLNLNSVSLHLVSDANDILNQKKAILLVKLNGKECIYKNAMRFSFDDPYLKITDFEIVDEPESIYVQSFHRHKKVFDNAFTVEMDVRFVGEKVDVANLHNSQLSMLCFVLDKIERTKAKIFTVCLGNGKYEQITISQEKLDNKQEESKPFAQSSKLSRQAGKKIIYAKNYFERNVKIKNNIKCFFNKIIFFKTLSLNYIYLLAISFFFLILSLCCLVVTIKKIKLFKLILFYLGFMAGILVLPLIIKALLISNYFF